MRVPRTTQSAKRSSGLEDASAFEEDRRVEEASLSDDVAEMQ